MAVTVPSTCVLDALNVIYRDRFHIRVRPDGSGRWDVVSIIDGLWFREAPTPEQGIALAIQHIDATYPVSA